MAESKQPTSFFAIRHKPTGNWWHTWTGGSGFGECPRLYPDERSIRAAMGQVKTKERQLKRYWNRGNYRTEAQEKAHWEAVKDTYEIVEIGLVIRDSSSE